MSDLLMPAHPFTPGADGRFCVYSLRGGDFVDRLCNLPRGNRHHTGGIA